MVDYKLQWYRDHRDLVNARRRVRHMEVCQAVNARRRERYLEVRERILSAMRADRAKCPICDRTYRRRYLPAHIAKRHESSVH